MRRVTIAITMVLILAAAVQISFIVDSYPGFHSDADCSLCHNEPVSAYNASFADAEITLDGFQTEEFWSDSVYGQQMEYPLASGSNPREHVYIVLRFAQNTTHLFVWVDWKDVEINGSDTQRYGTADGIAIMWNAHPGEYDQKDGWFNDMKTDNPGEEIDVWAWKPKASETGAHAGLNTTNKEYVNLTGTVYDTMFDNEGWADDIDTNNDLSTGAAWGYIYNRHDKNYGLEFARPLVTNDPGDVQFDKIGYYEFSIALWNATSGEDHLMSFEHQVYIYGECEENCELGVEYVPTTVISNVTITETETAPINTLAVLTSLFSVVFAVRVIPRSRKN